MIELHNGPTSLGLVREDIENPYYRGTRFDRSGIILTLSNAGRQYVSQWFLQYDPLKHDAVGGPAEEFTQISYDEAEAGEGFLKIGVGILRRDAEPYDRFKLYEIIDEGERSFNHNDGSAVFGQRLNYGKYGYNYVKKVSIEEDGGLVIEHKLVNLGCNAMDFQTYNHNFFVLDGAFTGRDTEFDLPFKPSGHWRSEYDCVHLTDSGIRFTRDLEPGESVFMGDLQGPEPQRNYSFRLLNRAKGLTVDASSDATMDYAVFWCNHEVACLEPYIKFHIEPGESAEWNIRYKFGTVKSY